MMSGRPQYSSLLLEHFRHPRQVGGGQDNQAVVYTGEAGTPITGAVIRLHLCLRGNMIADARFQAYGCAATIAAGSWLAEWLCGKTVTEARALDHRAIETALALPPSKIHCAVLAVNALAAALDRFTEQHSN